MLYDQKFTNLGMDAFVAKNRPAPQAFFVVPIVGSVLIDFFNAGMITAFLNIF